MHLVGRLVEREVVLGAKVVKCRAQLGSDLASGDPSRHGNRDDKLLIGP